MSTKKKGSITIGKVAETNRGLGENTSHRVEFDMDAKVEHLSEDYDALLTYQRDVVNHIMFLAGSPHWTGTLLSKESRNRLSTLPELPVALAKTVTRLMVSWRINVPTTKNLYRRYEFSCPIERTLGARTSANDHLGEMIDISLKTIIMQCIKRLESLEISEEFWAMNIGFIGATALDVWAEMPSGAKWNKAHNPEYKEMTEFTDIFDGIESLIDSESELPDTLSNWKSMTMLEFKKTIAELQSEENDEDDIPVSSTWSIVLELIES